MSNRSSKHGRRRSRPCEVDAGGVNARIHRTTIKQTRANFLQIFSCNHAAVHSLLQRIDQFCRNAYQGMVIGLR